MKTETVNSITHAAGILFGIIFIPLLVYRAAGQGTSTQVACTVVYGLFFLTTFTLSTLFHAFRRPAIKIRFRILDHVSIYFFIAATYTPFVQHFVEGATGTTVLLLVWLFAFTGSFFKFYFVNRYALVSVVSYVFMGLLFLFFRKPFFANMPGSVISFIYCGVALYLLGVIFFLWRRWKYHHAIWHLFVLAGSICHFKAVWLSIR